MIEYRGPTSKFRLSETAIRNHKTTLFIIAVRPYVRALIDKKVNWELRRITEHGITTLFYAKLASTAGLGVGHVMLRGYVQGEWSDKLGLMLVPVETWFHCISHIEDSQFNSVVSSHIDEKLREADPLCISI